MQFTNLREELIFTQFKKKIEREIEILFTDRGFSPIEPWMFQSYDQFFQSNFRQDLSRTVKVLGGDSRIFILRPDITSNILAKIFAGWDGDSPLQVYYNSKIYYNGMDGRIQENYQMGIESLGVTPNQADLQILEMVGVILEYLGEPCLLELGSSQFLDGFFAGKHLSSDNETQLRRLIAAKNRHGLNAKLETLGLQKDECDFIFELQGDFTQILTLAQSLTLNKKQKVALEDLAILEEPLQLTGLLQRVKLDLAMVPDLDYYDGIIFKGYVSGIPRRVLSGGRYDRLTERFGRRVPAIGFMLDLDLITRIKSGREVGWKNLQ